MRGTTTIQSVSAKIEKLEAKIASYESKLTDAKAQLEEEKNNKNALIAKIITSQIGDLDETILQKILHDYNKEVGGNTESQDEKSNASATAPEENTESKEEEGSKDAVAMPDTHSSNINKEVNRQAEQEEPEADDDNDEDDIYRVGKATWDK